MGNSFKVDQAGPNIKRENWIGLFHG
jgi:hypothetical protein